MTTRESLGLGDYLLEALESRTLMSAGDLDATFGSGGMLAITQPPYLSGGSDVIVQTDGKMLVSGFNETGGTNIVRFDTNGTLDTAFGAGGHLQQTGYPLNIALQKDGKLLVASVGVSDASVILMRYGSNGTPDASFGAGGHAPTITSSTRGRPTSIGLQSDGKILLFEQLNGYDAIQRFTANGLVDSSFGSGGVVTLGKMTGGGMAVQVDNKIVVAGQVGTDSNYDAKVMRLNADGTLDASFGTGGKTKTDVGTVDLPQAVALQPDGRIVVYERTSPDSAPTHPNALIRYTASGQLDGTFANGGIARDDNGYSGGQDSLAIQSDGKILTLRGSADPNANLQLRRYSVDGQQDPTFGVNGVATITYKPGYTNRVCGLALTPDDRILVLDDCYDNSGGASVFMRLLGDGGGSATLNGGTLTITGTQSPDAITLTSSGSNVIATINGTSKAFTSSQVHAVSISSLGGNDRIVVGNGIIGCNINGGQGADTIIGGSGNDTIGGGKGLDSINGGAGDDQIHGGMGSDTIMGGDGFDQIWGDSGNNSINGGNQGDTIWGGDGMDTLGGGKGHDVIHASAGGSSIHGGMGNDTIFGGAGNDTIYGDAGNNAINGGGGTDTIYANNGQADTVTGTGGHVTVYRDSLDILIGVESSILS